MHKDQRYIDGLVNNHSSVIEEIYRLHAGRIEQLVLRNNGNLDDAKDLFQEVLMVLYHKGREGFVLTCPFGSFLYIACRSRWINELKKRGRRQVTIRDVDGLKGDTAIQNTWTELYAREHKEQLFYRKFRELGPSCQELLGLSWTQNPNTKKYNTLYEIAELVDNSYGYVRRKIADCRSRLMQLIRESDDFDQI